LYYLLSSDIVYIKHHPSPLCFSLLCPCVSKYIVLLVYCSVNKNYRHGHHTTLL